MSDSKQEDTTAAFRLKEFEILRTEIEHRSQEQRAMERNVVILTAGILSFLVSDHVSQAEPGLLSGAWFIPPFVSLLALDRWLESLSMIKTVATYLQKLEKELAVSGGGWEMELARLRAHHKLQYCSRGNKVFWIGISGITAGIAAYHKLQNVFWAICIGALAAGIAGFLIHRAELDVPGYIK